LRRLFDVEFQYPGYMSIFMFPFSMLSSTFGYSYSLQNFFPSAHSERTHFNSRLLTSRAASGVDAEVLESFFSSTAQVNRQVFEEDHAICRRLRSDTWSSEPLKYSASREAKLLHFRRSYTEAMREAGVP
jgi:hypothetical protein